MRISILHLAGTNFMLLLLLFFPLSTSQAQEPLPFPSPRPSIPLDNPIRLPNDNPPPQTQLTSSISGVVRGPTGEIVPGAEVRIRNKNDGSERTVTTDESGRFQVTGLVPGPYQIRVSLGGFSVGEREVVLGVSQAATVDFVNDVPVGTPSSPVSGGGGSGSGSGSSKTPPRSDTRSFEIYSKTFERDIELANWLQLKKAERKRLSRIIYVSDKTSLFILEQVKAGVNFNYTVTPPINEALDPDNMLTRINQNSGKTFVGIHRIADNSYLMVFYD